LATSSSNINDTFFAGNYKEVWRKLIPPGLSEVECSFVEEIAGLQKGEAVLDLMCGYGRHAVELARRGYAVTAIDNLPVYIAEIEAKAATENLPITTITAGALDVSLHHPFKAILCMGNSFAFFNKDEALFLLRKLAAHLQPDGVFVINTWMIAEIAMRHFQDREWYPVEDYKYLLRYQFLFQPNRIVSEHTLLASDGTIEVIQGVDYVLTLDEMETLFHQAGLRLREVYSTPKKRKFKMGDNKAYLIIEKAADNTSYL
jgi:cyclopropane fatty-acyl-phospholipid synthase-like methyltransferase